MLKNLHGAANVYKHFSIPPKMLIFLYLIFTINVPDCIYLYEIYGGSIMLYIMFSLMMAQLTQVNILHKGLYQ